MQLHLINGSPNGRKVLSVVKHLGLRVEIVWLNLFEGDTKTSEYLSLSPSGLSPVLVDGDFVLWESNAIIVYLCSQVPNQTLYPKDVKGQADILRWLCWELAHYNKALGIISWQSVAKPAFGFGEPDHHLISEFIEQFERFAPVLEKHLEGRTYIVGNDWTIADYALGHIEMFIDVMPIDWNRFPNLISFYERLRTNKYWSATAANSHTEIGQIPNL